MGSIWGRQFQFTSLDHVEHGTCRFKARILILVQYKQLGPGFLNTMGITIQCLYINLCWIINVPKQQNRWPGLTLCHTGPFSFIEKKSSTELSCYKKLWIAIHRLASTVCTVEVHLCLNILFCVNIDIK